MGDNSCCAHCRFNIKEEFETVLTCKANGIVPVTKYVSKSTGLEIVHAEVEGPTVNGYIVISTRAEDEDGLPHTLEHLVFLGSERYPFKGVLDRLANKCLASGTNAWTDVDHTCYTLTTAGSGGFCNILPIFMDHIFYPLLTQAAFKTEVHHVTGMGTDGGVVYSEMQALENACYEKSTNALMKAVYPPESGYYYNVGGMLENLRESCNNEKVKEFHRKFYHPRNACVIVCGRVPPKKLLRSLIPTVKKFMERRAGLEEWTKPWISETLPDLSNPVEKTLQFASDEEVSRCLVTIGFLGNFSNSDVERMCAMVLLFKYLTSTSCAPVQQAFVEREDSLATSVEFSTMENRRPIFFWEFEGVNNTDTSSTASNLRSTLQSQLKSFDMGRMSHVINKSIHAGISALENTGHSVISSVVIRDFIYGSSSTSDLEKLLNEQTILEEFYKKPKDYWTDILQDGILGPHWVTIVAQPSRDFQHELGQREADRIAARKATLGEDTLMKLAHELDDAILMNSMPIPDKILKSVKVPPMKSISHHRLTRMQNPKWAAEFPANLFLDDISTVFVYLGVLMDTSGLDDQFRPFLPLFKEVILNSSILKDNSNEVMSCEQAAAERFKDLQIIEIDLGLEVPGAGGRFSGGSYSHFLALGFQMDADKIEQGLDWARKILWNTKWEVERIQVAIGKMIGEIFLLRRDASHIHEVILKDLIYKDKSNVKASSLLHQLDFLHKLDDKLRTSPEEVITALDTILKIITNPYNVSVHIAANFGMLRGKMAGKVTPGQTVDAWLVKLLMKSFPFGVDKPQRRLANSKDFDWLLPLSELKKNPRKQVIFGLGSADSSFLVMVAPGPTNFLHKDLPALLTTLQYFTQLEGPFYHKIRGRGYAYSYSAVTRVSEGLVYFYLSRCCDLVGAYAATITIFNAHLSKSIKWTKELLTTAKSSLIFELLESEKTPLAIASNSLLGYYRNVPGTYNRYLCKKIGRVRISDLNRITKHYLAPLFSDNFPCVVVCPGEQVEVISEGFKKMGRTLLLVQSFEQLS